MATFKYMLTRDDEMECHAALKEWGAQNPDRPLGDPTFLAYKDDRLVGVISTAPLAEARAVVCNRLAVVPDMQRIAKGFLVVRMVEAYEAFLRKAGVRWYHVSLDTSNTRFIRLIASALGEPYAADEDLSWFKREIA